VQRNSRVGGGQERYDSEQATMRWIVTPVPVIRGRLRRMTGDAACKASNALIG